MGNKPHKYIYGICCLLLLLQSCSVSKQINKQAHKILLQDGVINTGHIGISIYEPATNSYWYNYNADKYFVPASNVKLFTLYAGMKYLGDSLAGLRYDTTGYCTNIQGTGDPTFLHPGFKDQPVFDFLAAQKKNICLSELSFTAAALGDGWAWNDYDKAYMAPRSPMPVYGNLIRFYKTNPFKSDADSVPPFSIEIEPGYFNKDKSFGNVRWKDAKGFSIARSFESNALFITPGNETAYAEIPFTNSRSILWLLLEDTLHKPVIFMGSVKKKLPYTVYSNPADSLFTPMMHNSDNFFAEQTLLMASNEHLGYMNDEHIIDTLLQTDLKDVPQLPRWVDGSGLSRYNLFTPRSFVYILNKMQNEFGLARLKTILPTGGQGTLKNYYQSDSSYIYAKTGSLSNQVALSGFLITRQNKLLVFSLLTNNALGDGWRVRRAYESFLKGIREKY